MRRAVLVAVATVVLVVAALGAWSFKEGRNEGKNGSRDGGRQVALPPVHRAGNISAQELRRYPSIVLVVADRNRASSTASGDLYIVHADGSGLRRLKGWTSYQTAPDGRVYGTYAARWSPDRRLIALDLSVWFGDPYGQVAVVAPSGRQVRTLSESSDVGNLSWSRQGALGYTYGGELRVVSPRAHRTELIWNPGQDVIGGMGQGDVDWSPDGRRLVVKTSKGIATVSPAGRKVAWLTHTQRDGAPGWAPNGRAIAFVRSPRCFDEYECKAPSNVYVVTPDGSSLRRLTEHSNANSLFWSPNGRSILFTADSPNDLSEGNIAVVGADGRDLRRLASNARALGWSPDGKKVLYSHRDGLWLMDADGGRPTRLAMTGPGHELTIITADWGSF
jgi:hypothetical protein